MANGPMQTLKMVPDGLSRFSSGIQIGSSQIATIRDEHSSMRDAVARVCGKDPERLSLQDVNGWLDKLQERSSLSLEVRLHGALEAIEAVTVAISKDSAEREGLLVEATIWLLSLSK